MKSAKPQFLTKKCMNDFFSIGEQKGYTEALKRVPPLSTMNIQPASLSVGDTLLFMAAQDGYPKAVRALSAVGVRSNDIRLEGYSPLYFAALNGHLEVIKALLQLKADVNVVAAYNDHTPLIAAVNEHPEVMQLLIDAKADVNKQMKSGDVPLSFAATSGKLESIEILLANKADAKIFVRGASLISLAAEQGRADVIRILAAAAEDMDTDTPNAQGATPTYMAAHFGHADAVRALHEVGADISKPIGSDGELPLFTAIRNGYLKTTQVILDLKKIDVFTLGQALWLAEKTPHTDVVKLLKQYINKPPSVAPQAMSVQVIPDPSAAQLSPPPSEKKVKAKAKNTVQKYEDTDIRKVFLTSLHHHLSMLALIKNELNPFKAKSTMLKLEIFKKIKETMTTLNNTLEGNKNNERLSHISAHLQTLSEASDCHVNIQNQTELLAMMDSFSTVCSVLQNQFPTEESKMSVEIFEKYTKIQAALRGENTVLKSETLKLSLEELSQVWKEISEKYKQFSKWFQDLKKLNEHLDSRVTTIKSFRVLCGNTIISKRDLRNTKTLSLTDSKKIEENLKLINEKLNEPYGAPESQPAPPMDSRVRTIKSCRVQRGQGTISKRDLRNKKTLSPTDSKKAEGNLKLSDEKLNELHGASEPQPEPHATTTAAPTATIASVTPPKQKKVNKLPLEERKRLLKLFAREAAQKMQKKFNQEKIKQEQLEKKALGIKREVKGSQESPKHSEHSVALRLQLEQLEIIVKQVKMARLNGTLSILKSIFALCGSMSKVNELVVLEHKDSTIRKVARLLRNAIYKRHEIMLEKADHSFEALLNMADSWHTFIQKIELGCFTSAAAVVRAIGSVFLEAVYNLGKTLDGQEKNLITELEILKCVQAIEEMTRYWKMRKEEGKEREEEMINLVADKFCWGIIGSAMRKLQKAVNAGIVGSIDAFRYTLNLLVPNCDSEFIDLRILAKAFIDKGIGFRHEWAILKNSIAVPYILMDSVMPELVKEPESALSTQVLAYLASIEAEISDNKTKKMGCNR
jgi:ankyrin repeat protein